MKKNTNLFSLKNKVVLITGAGTGIGKYLAEQIAKQDAIVFSIDKEFQKKISKSVKNIFEIECDITDQPKFKKVCSEIIKKKKRIDVLINNAGVSMANKESGKMYEKAKWDKTIEINLTSHFVCSQEVIKYMKKQKNGSIINITSIGSELGFAGNPGYVSSKGGLKMLTKALANDLAEFNIRVNNIAPGYIRTDMTKGSYEDQVLNQDRVDRMIIKRWGDVGDLSGAAILLASEASSYITGIDLFIDGGWTAKGL